MDSPDDPILNHLRIAIKSALFLFAGVFVIGVVSGWAIAHYREARIGALLGFLIGTGFASWISWLYYATRGLLHDRGVRT